MDQMASDNVCAFPCHLRESTVESLCFKHSGNKLTVIQRNELLLSFLATEAGRSATIIGDEDNCFIIRCSSEAMEIFIDLAQKLVRAEKERELQTREKPKLLRIRRTETHNSEQAVSNVDSKFDISDVANTTKTFNFPVLEGIKDKTIMLQMIALKDLNDRRLGTTLLRPHSPLLKTLRGALVMVMIIDGEAVQIKENPREEPRGLLWQDHAYKSFGDEDTVSISIEAAESSGPKALDTPVAKWVEKSSFAPIVDPFSPTYTSGNLVDVDRAAVKVSPKKLTKRVRAAKGNAENTVPNASLQNNEQCQDVVLGTRAPGNKSSSPHEEQLDGQGYSRIPKPPRIEPPFMPALPPVGTNAKATNRWESNVVQSGRAVKDGLFELSQPVRETQTTDQAEALRHRTMNQRKPPAHLIGSAHSLTKSLEEPTLEILNLALHRGAPIRLMVSIGRLLINHQTFSTEFKRKPFAPQDWNSAFPETGVSHVEFTEMLMRPYVFSGRHSADYFSRLTTRSSDAESILNIKLSQGRRVFVEQATERTVKYVFQCQSSTNEQVSVEVDEGGVFEVRGPSQPVGTLNFHFVRRAWDARLNVSCCGALYNDYQEQAQCIINNLKICPSSAFEGVKLSTQTKDQDFRIQSIVLQRRTTHTSPIYPDLLLHLCENQDLGVNQKPMHSQTGYYGSIKPREQMVAAGRLWWESSLSSVSAAATLKDNGTELGKQATWEPRNVIGGGIVGDMVSLASDIVIRIDNVGMHNKGPGGAGSGSKTAMQTSENAHELPTGKWGFW